MTKKERLIRHYGRIKTALEAAEAQFGKDGLKALHDALWQGFLALRDELGLTDDPDVQALSGGEDKPPKEDEEEPGGGD